MILKELLPEPIEREVERISRNGEVEVSISGDVDAEGLFGEQWLVLTGRKLLVLHTVDAGVSVRVELDLDDLVEVFAHSMIGGGTIEALTTEGSVVELVRYSNPHTDKFAAAAKWITSRAKGEEPGGVSEEVQRRCPKCGLLLRKGSKVCPRCVHRRKVIVRLLGYLKPYWHMSVVVGLLMLLGEGGMLIPPYLGKILIDDVLVTQNYGLLGWIVLAMVGISLMAKAMLALRGRISAWLGSIITHEIRSELYGKVQSMSLRFFDRYQTGELMSRVSRDTRELNDFMASQIPHLVTSFLRAIAISVILVVMNWKLALLTIIPAPIVAFSTMAIWKRIRYYYRRAWHRRAQLSAALNDTLSGIRVVKGFAQEEKQAEMFGRKSYDLYHATKRAEQLMATWMPMLSFMLGAGTLIVWYFGGRDVMRGVADGGMSIGTLWAFFAYLVMFLGPLEMVMRISTHITRAFAASERVFEILDMESEVPDEAEIIPMPDLKGHVEFRDVTFGYDRHKPVLHNIDLKVEPGEMIGFVGRSGAGKTTMTNLICRFYTPDEGGILIDEVDTKKIGLDDLRRQIGIVLQEPFLFNGTIAENIGYAKPGATMEEIMRASRIANAHEFILKFPDGYDTITGERGQRLSGGERQRISIARAILRDPKILILDEPTSMVDTMTEKKIQEALSRLVKGRTTFAIAHRLSTLRNANRLVVLEEGKVVETGTHDELMEKVGTYRKLVDLQREMSHIKGVDG